MDFPVASAARTQALVVLGPHRSGTSALAGVLGLCGAQTPRTLMAPAIENPRGFWESRKVMKFNEALLEAAGSGWSDPSDLPDPSWFASADAARRRHELSGILRDEYGESPAILVKDPRICRLVPFWDRVLEELGVAPFYVLIARHPVDVSLSLLRRNGLPVAVGVLLWLAHMIAAERDTRSRRRVICTYDHLLDDWQSLITRIHGAIGTAIPAPGSEVVDRVSAFLDPDLRHFDGDFNPGDGAGQLLPIAVDAYECFAAAIANGDVDRSGMDSIRRRLDEIRAHLGSRVVELWRTWDQHRRLALELEHRADPGKPSKPAPEWVEKPSSDMTRLRDAVLTLASVRGDAVLDEDVGIDALVREVDRSREDLQQARETIRDLRQSLAELSDSLQSRMAEVQQLYQRARSAERGREAMESSRMWRLGESIVDVLRRLRYSRPGQVLLHAWWWSTFRWTGKRARQREAAIIRSSGVFDEEYYLREYPALRLSILDPIDHYVHFGAREGRRPNLVFDSSFYLERYPDAQEDGTNPLAHYVSTAAQTNRDPNPMFDARFYADSNPEVHELGMTPLEHYLKIGMGDGRRIHAIFDADFYRRTGPVAPGLDENPLAHFLARGVSQGALPNFACRLSAEVVSALRESTIDRALEEEAGDIRFEPCAGDPEASIVVPFFNNASCTIRCLKSLARQSGVAIEVIVIDDGSEPSEGDVVRLVGGVRHLRNEHNLGYLQSCNRAAAHARGRYVVMLNNDTVLLPTWLEALLETFAIHPDAGLAGSMLLYPDGRLQEAGSLVFEDGSGWNVGRNQDPNACEYNFARKTDYCSGASIALPTSLWQRLGGYDPAFSPAYYEDTDLAFRVRQIGCSVMYNPRSKVIHFEGVSSGTNVNGGVKRYQRTNRSVFLDRWRAELKGRMSDGKVAPYLRRNGLRARLLWIDTTTPTPEEDSGSVDTVNFFNVAIREGWGVTFLPWDNLLHGGTDTERLQSMGVECLYHPYVQRDTIIPRIAGDFDVVVVSRAPIAPEVLPIVRQAAARTRVVFNTIDLHFLRRHREADLFGESERARRERELEQRMELDAVRRADATIVVSDAEAAILRDAMPDANVHVIPLFRNIPGTGVGFEERRDICFLGGFRHPPNRDAVKWFVREIWPRIEDELDDCRFLIAGSNMPRDIVDLASGRIEALGFVDDIGSLFDRARISVAPVRYGAGVKGKIVSSISHGLPTVTTDAALEGMGLADGVEVMVGNTPKEFARAVVALYTDRESWERISVNAVAAARRCHSFDAVAPRIHSLLNDMLVRQ